MALDSKEKIFDKLYARTFCHAEKKLQKTLYTPVSCPDCWGR